MMLPEGWRQARLDVMCELVNGRGFKPHEWAESGLPIIRIQNLNGGTDFNYYSGNYDPKIEVENGQLLFAWSGSRGTSFGPHIWNGPKAVLNYHTWKVVPRESISKIFLHQNLRFITAKIESTAHGASALVHTQKGEMEKYLVLLPPLPEQRKIAEILSTWDAAISAQERLIANAKRQKQALMQTLATGKNRLPGFSGKWTFKPIGKVARIYDGTHMTPDYVQSGVPFYSVEHLTSDNFENTKYISELVFADECRRVRLEKHDILMTRIGDIGTAKLIDWQVRASFYVSLALIKSGPSVSAAFLAQFISTSAYRRELHKRTIHVAFPKKINLGEIGKCLVAIPPLEEQRRIAEILSSSDKEITNHERNLETLRQEKSALMQQLLTGKRRVRVSQKEAA
jgi:type I restriction enzyme, S subunit